MTRTTNRRSRQARSEQYCLRPLRPAQLSVTATIAIALAALSMLGARASPEPDKYEVYAVRFATIVNFPVSSLVAGADRARRMDIAMMIWVLKGVDGRVAIVDSGFHRDRYFQQFEVQDYVKPSAALAPLGLRASDVTDV